MPKSSNLVCCCGLCCYYHKCTGILLTNNHHISARVRVIKRQRERCRRAKVDRGQLEREQCPLSPTNLMTHQFPAAAKTPVLPQLLANSTTQHKMHTDTHRETHMVRHTPSQS